MPILNQKGVDLIKKWEGCAARSYLDIHGIWTIGYGHTGIDVTENLVWTQDQIEAALIQDLERFRTIEDFISEQINDNQFSALICLAYNVGLNAVIKSKCLKLVNAGEDPTTEWQGFCHVGSRVVPGLVRRRQDELELYHEIG